MNARLMIGGLLLAASTALFAQAPAKPGGTRPDGMGPCAQEPDPAKCEAQRKVTREQYIQAREACKGREGAARSTCIAQHMCAKAPDQAKCQADAKKRMEQRREMREKNSAPKA